MEGNRVKWLVDWQDLNKSPFKDWIFSNISLLGKCLKQKLSKDFEDDVTRIYRFMPPKVRDEVKDRFNRLRNKIAETSLLNCLSFLNTLHLARNQGYFNDVIGQDYEHKIAFIHSSNELRNKSAHANDIITSKVDLVKLEQTISRVRKMIVYYDVM